METASPPSYDHTAPPPPYTAHARLGEVSIHRSYHYEPPPDQNDPISDDGQLVDNGQATVGWSSDIAQEYNVSDDNDATRNDTSYIEQQVAIENSEQTSYYEEQPSDTRCPLATSTPSSSQHELSPNSAMFVKSLVPLPQNSSLQPVKAIPRLRPIRPQALSAPNLLTPHPPPATHEPLNNTLPRMGHLPPLRRKLNYPNMTNSPHHVRSLSEGRLPSPFHNHQMLSRSISTGEYEPISEVSCEPSSNDTIDNL